MQTEARKPIVVMTGVSKSYGKVRALEGLDLEVRPGEVLALLGPNGAGKTTAVSLMIGLMQPDQGQVTLFDRAPTDREARTRFGVMLQVSGVPENLKVREHLALFSSYYPDPLPVAELLDLAGLTEQAERPFGKLSGGQQQRVLFAIALCGRPKLVFLDEPTNGMDVQARHLFWQKIQGLVARGTSVVLCTHYLEEADAVADRIVLIDKGRVVAMGSTEEIKRHTRGKWIRCRTKLSEEELGAMPGVLEVARSDGRVQISTNQAERTIADLLRQDPDVSDLEVVSASLEEAFLQLTQEPEEVYA